MEDPVPIISIIPKTETDKGSLNDLERISDSMIDKEIPNNIILDVQPNIFKYKTNKNNEIEIKYFTYKDNIIFEATNNNLIP